MENTNNVEVTETLNTKTYKRNPLILLKPIPLKVFAIILLIFVIFFVILLKSSHGAILNTKNGASKLYIKYCTKTAILYNYSHSLKFPDSFKLENIEYESTSYKDAGYELWVTTGYFTTEEKAVGIKEKTTYTIYMQYSFEEKECYCLLLIIDNKIYFGSYDNISQQITKAKIKWS